MKRSFTFLLIILFISCDTERVEQAPSHENNDQVVIKGEEVDNEVENKRFDCYDGTQLEMNVCSLDEYEYYDSILEIKVTQLKKSMQLDLERYKKFSDQSEYENLLIFDSTFEENQRKWLEYRDDNEALVGLEYEGGTIRPLMVNLELIELTKDRIRFVKSLLSEE